MKKEINKIDCFQILEPIIIQEDSEDLNFKYEIKKSTQNESLFLRFSFNFSQGQKRNKIIYQYSISFDKHEDLNNLSDFVSNIIFNQLVEFGHTKISKKFLIENIFNTLK